MLHKCVVIVNDSPVVGSLMSQAIVKEWGCDNVVLYGAKESLVEKIPPSLTQRTVGVIVPADSYSKEKDVRGIIAAVNMLPDVINVVFHFSKKPYKVVSSIEDVEIIEADLTTSRGIDEALAVCGVDISDEDLRTIAHNPMSREVVEGVLVQVSPGDVVSRDIIERAIPDVSRNVWEASSLIFSGAAPKKILDLFDSIRASGGKPEMVSGYVCKQVRIAVSAQGVKDKKDVLVRMGVSPRAVYPVSKNLPRWSPDACRRAAEVSAQLDAFTKSSASHRINVDARWAAVETLCIVLASLGGSREYSGKKRKGIKAKARSSR